MLRLEVSKHSLQSSGRNFLSLIMVFVYFELYFLPVRSAFCTVIFSYKYIYAKTPPKLLLNHISLLLIQKWADFKLDFRRFPYGACALMGRKCDCAVSTPLPCSRGKDNYNILLWSCLKHFSILLLHKTVWHAMNYIFTVRQTCLSVQSRDTMMCFFCL